MAIIDMGFAGRPCPGQEISGDAGGARPHASGTLLWMVDVLGHGPEAFTVCRRAVQTITQEGDQPPLRLMQALHRTLDRTRGAAIGLLQISANRALWLGIGNISMVLWSRQGYHWRQVNGMERSGIVGDRRLPRLRPQQFTLTGDDYVYLHSDGVAAACEDETPIDETCQHMAESLLARHGLADDDATILVARFQHGHDSE